MNLFNLKYGAEAIFLLGIAYRLLRWVVGALAEGDAPPSAYVADDALAPRALVAIPRVGATLTLSSTAGTHASPTQAPPQSPPLLQLTLGSPTPTQPPLLTALERLASQPHDLQAPPHAGDPALFPQAMLDAMTPDQRAQVLNTLLKQRTSGTGR
jgi:hypothetical protein